MTPEKPLAKRLVLITGASRGLGRALALAAAAAGADLILVARTVGALEEVDDATRKLGAQPATLVPLDLKEEDAIDRLGAALYERHGRLDALAVAHGTLGQLSPVGHIRPKIWDDVIQTNLTAPYRLIRSLDPLLGQSKAPRVLVVTDETGRGRAYWGPYAGSKRALEELVLGYAGERNDTAWRINLAAPPPMATRLRSAAYPGEDQANLPAPEEIAPLLLPALFEAEARHGEILRPRLERR